MDKLELLKLAEQQDVEAYDNEDFELPQKNFSEQYRDFYDDVKQPNNYIKEDWQAKVGNKNLLSLTKNFDTMTRTGGENAFLQIFKFAFWSK